MSLACPAGVAATPFDPPTTDRPPPALTTADLDLAPPPPLDVPSLDGLTVPVVLNGPVRDFLSFFQGRGRGIYAAWYARMGAYAPLMVPVLERHGLPPELIYVCMIESGFNPDAVSKAAAVGPWQFLRNTGRSFGLRYDDWVDGRRDPIRATEAAARYFKQMYTRFGSWPLVLAAYNAGDGAVGRAIRRTSSNDFWTLVERGVLPTEATRYVPKIMAAIVIGQNPARYGFGGVVPDSPLAFTEVAVPGKTALSELARRADVPTATLAQLNPELRRGYTPPDGQDYALRVPPEAAERLTASLAQRPPRGQVFVEHSVRFGERLRDIAKAYGTRRRTLRQLNELSDGEEPVAGQVLVVPKPDRAPAHPLDGELLVVLDHDVEFAPTGKQRIFFPVRRRYSVGEVAAFFGVTPGQIGMWNAVDPAVPLQRGMVLRLYVSPSFPQARALLASPSQVTVVEPNTEAASNALTHARQPRPPSTRRVEYTVKAGDGLGKIARRFGVSVPALRAENGMPRDVVIAPGDVLWVPANRTPRAKGKARRTATKREARGRTGYTVKSGDSLGKIARKFGVDLDALRRRNGMRRSARIYPGQRLIIP